MSNDHFSSGSIRIEGSGNAVGNRNRVTNIQKQTNHFHQRPSGGGGQSKGNDGLSAVIGIVFGAAIALAALSFWFAKYSEQIYDALTFTAYASGALCALVTAFNLRAGTYSEALRNAVVTLVATAGGLAVSVAYSTMPAAIGELAQSGTFTSFGCRLSLAGQQTASQHSVLGAFALIPLALLTALQTLRACFYVATDEGDLPEWIESAIKSTTGTGLFAAMLFLCALSFASYTDAGERFWKERFNSRIEFMCGTHR